MSIALSAVDGRMIVLIILAMVILPLAKVED